jgi:biopolymer transport protein ExbB/TolQ
MKWRQLKNDPIFKDIGEKYYSWSAPLVGLFGTAYGILDAFENLQTGNAVSSVIPAILKGLLFTPLVLIILFFVMLLHYSLRRQR